MEGSAMKTSKKGKYDPKVKPEEYTEWLITLCKLIANGKNVPIGSLLNEKGSQK